MSTDNGAVAQLVSAVRGNDVAAVRHALDTHPELRAQLNGTMPGLDFGATPLIAALTHENTKLLEVLLDAGADINQKSHWWAGGFGVLDHKHDLAPWLIAHGARVDVHAAARLGMLDELKTLIDADHSLVHARGGDGQTPLHVASSIDIAAFLLERGADIDALDVDHESTPAQYMIRDRTDIARYLVDRGARTDIFLVSALGDMARVRATLDANPDAVRLCANAESFPRRNPHASLPIYVWTLGGNHSPHWVARDFGHADVLSLLFERSPADLQRAVACELEDAALLHAAAPGDATPSPDLHVRLIWAAERNTVGPVRMLLEAGWPVDARDARSTTALHFAAWHGNADMVRVLLEHGAPTTIRERSFDGTPLDWAKHGVNNSWHRATGNYPAVLALLQ